MTKVWIALLAAVMAGAAQAQGKVEVKDAWVRGMVATQDTTGAFMRIRSQSSARLVGAKTPAAKLVEIHRTTMEGGVMRMRPVDAIELPAGQAVELKPGGYHVMLMQVPRPLEAGTSVSLTLIVEAKDGTRTEVTVQAPVRSLTAPAGGHKMH
jgi:copper(I)-binding protein